MEGHSHRHPELERQQSAITNDNSQGEEEEKAALLATLEAEPDEEE